MNKISSVDGAVRKGGRVTATLDDGTPYHYRYYAGSRNSPSYFQVSVPCSKDIRFTISREKGTHRFFKGIGISKEIETGDRLFDDEFYISTNSEDQMQQLLSDEKIREKIRDIFANDFKVISYKGRVMETRISPFSPRDDFDVPMIRETSERLNDIAKHIPEEGRTYPAAITPDWKIKRIVAITIPLIIELFGILLLIFGLIKYTPLDKGSVILKGAIYGLPFLALFLPFAFFMVKGRSKSHVWLIIISFISLTAFPAMGAGILVFMNGALDNAPAETYTVSVIRKYDTRSDNSIHYHIVTESWRGYSEEDISVNRTVYRATKPNQTIMKITTHTGRFGYEWMEDYRLRNP